MSSTNPWPDSPLKLLQTRYQAYVDGDVDFLLASVHPEKKSKHSRKTIEEWSKNAVWKGIKVEKEENENSRAWLTFQLKYEEEGQEVDHRERAEFRQHQGRWFYYDSKFPSVEPLRRDPNKVGRNDPCSCGSGKKYKKCCGQ